MQTAISLKARFLINLPAFLCMLGAALCAVLFFAAGSHWLFLPAGWMCLCGGVMLLRDYHARKRAEFCTMLDIVAKRGPGSIPLQSLKATVCGYCMLQALRLYTNNQEGENAGTV